MRRRRGVYKRRRRGAAIAVLLLVISLLATGVYFAIPKLKSLMHKDETPPVAVEQHEPTLDEKAEAILSQMSLTEKIGQMVMIGIQPQNVDDNVRYMINQFHFGGIILFDRNLASKEQTKNLVDSLQDTVKNCKKCQGKIPLFIAVDEEGGTVARMKSFVKPPLSQLEIGNTGDSANARKSAEDIAAELEEMGYNLNFAPVADLGSLGSTRHFSEDPETASRFVIAAADGYEAKKMIYTIKHFPGIGKGKADSHNNTVTVNISKEEWQKTDLVPFKAIIDSREPEDYMVMISHVTYPNIAGNVPASISKTIMTDILRNELGYEGIIITDDMDMGAIANHYGYRNLGEKVVEAGGDIILVCHEYKHEEDVYMGLLNAVKDGKIPEERINESVKRIIKAKLKNIDSPFK